LRRKGPGRAESHSRSNERAVTGHEPSGVAPGLAECGPAVMIIREFPDVRASGASWLGDIDHAIK